MNHFLIEVRTRIQEIEELLRKENNKNYVKKVIKQEKIKLNNAMKININQIITRSKSKRITTRSQVQARNNS